MSGARVTSPLAARLGIVRIAIGALCVWTLLRYPGEVPGLGAEPGAVFMPVGIASLLESPFSSGFVAVWQAGTTLLALAWTAGWAWRITAPCFAAGFLAWATWRLCWGGIAHDLHLVTLHVIALAFLPAAGALSVDARRATPSRLAWIPTGPEAEVWVRGALRLVGALTVTTYALAGLAKVNQTWTFAWASGASLVEHVSLTGLIALVYAPSIGLPPGFTFLLDHPALLSFGAVLTLVLELGAPLALLHRHVGIVWAAGILAMHIGIAGGMGVVFPYQTFGLALLSFVPAERLVRRRAG